MPARSGRGPVGGCVGLLAHGGGALGGESHDVLARGRGAPGGARGERRGLLACSPPGPERPAELAETYSPPGPECPGELVLTCLPRPRREGPTEGASACSPMGPERPAELVSACSPHPHRGGPARSARRVLVRGGGWPGGGPCRVGSAVARQSLADEREKTRHSRSRPSWRPITAAAPPWRCAAQLHGACGRGGVRRVSEVEVASSVDRLWSPDEPAEGVPRRGGDGAADRGRSVAMWAKDAARALAVAAAESYRSEGRREARAATASWPRRCRPPRRPSPSPTGEAAFGARRVLHMRM